MTGLAAALAFIAGSSLAMWWWTLLHPAAVRFPGRRKPQGPDQEPVPAPEEPGFLDRLERAAAAAGLRWTRREFLQFILLASGAAVLLAMLGLAVPALVVAAAAWRGPEALLNKRRRQRNEKFSSQLPQALFLATSTLRAGGTLLQAVEAMAEQMPPPLGDEFRLALQAIRLGAPVPEALAGIHARTGLREFGAVVVAARVSNELGGDSALTFERIAQAMMDAESYRRSLKAYTTEGRMSAMLITGLPFGIMGILSVLAPGYFDPLFFSTGGQILLGLCLAGIFTGWTIIRRILSPDHL